MSNVIQLFEPKNVRHPPAPDTSATIAATNILASNTQLARSIGELSFHIEAIDRAIDAIDDIDSRTRLKGMLRLACERLANLVLRQSQETGRLARYLIHDIKTCAPIPRWNC